MNSEVQPFPFKSYCKSCNSRGVTLTKTRQGSKGGRGPPRQVPPVCGRDAAPVLFTPNAIPGAPVSPRCFVRPRDPGAPVSPRRFVQGLRETAAAAPGKYPRGRL